MAPLFPQLPVLSSNPGYTEAHAAYALVRNYYASKAFSSGNTQTVSVQCWLARMEAKKAKPTPIHDIYMAMNNVPVNIGVRDLKELVRILLLPQIISWVRGYDLSTVDFTLRKEHWIELVAQHPDVNAIAEDFFVTKANPRGLQTRTFSNKHPAKLYLGIDNPTYNTILAHFDELDSPLVDDDEEPPMSSRTSRTKVSSYYANWAEPLLTHLQTSGNPGLTTSPEAAHIKNALMLQVQPKLKAAKSVCSDFLIYILPGASWKTLIQNPRIFSDVTKGLPTHDVIFYNTKAQPVSGGFKSALPGRSKNALFPDSSPSKAVCLKQGFHLQSGDKVMYEGVSQVKFLCSELNLLGWGDTMMDLVYVFMERSESELGRPPFEIPVMRFVSAGLAISQSNQQEAFMVEEWIDPETQGPFVKYIHNNSGRPRDFERADHQIRAEFLSFCQHVQYFKTNGAAYISDFQGGLELLTDPQIISDP
ncbi:hypothetical protein FB45DRAFT_832782 [Roridomyces roridus]|uniref:Alpha-type protein kinase domain-containing protein n=1 Tax=Roridomyces roridus TaxID=1738132 RepID=A0AAD7FKN4_9AGAR|nr:hypothetical protein FB45DRAFT_832782 [Roridomyces roridus]